MSVDECITAYTNLRLGSEITSQNSDDPIEAEKQKKIIDDWLTKLLRDRSLTRDELFQSVSAVSCKV